MVEVDLVTYVAWLTNELAMLAMAWHAPAYVGLLQRKHDESRKQTRSVITAAQCLEE